MDFHRPKDVNVICGFPGVGKSELAKLTPAYTDLYFPGMGMPEYIQRIKEALAIPGMSVLVPSWPHLRQAMHDAEIPFMLFYPSMDLKCDYIQRYVRRRSPNAMVSVMDSSWEKFIQTCIDDVTPHKFEMRQSQAFLADYFI